MSEGAPAPRPRRPATPSGHEPSSTPTVRTNIVTTSCIESSISWPRPVCCCCTYAAVTASAAIMPLPVSAKVPPERSGGPSGSPVSEKMPPAACASGS